MKSHLFLFCATIVAFPACIAEVDDDPEVAAIDAEEQALNNSDHLGACEDVPVVCNSQPVAQPGESAYYFDNDVDGHGDAGCEVFAKARPCRFSPTDDDCDDLDAAVNPSAVEVCGNGIDDNCQGGDLNCNMTCTPVAVHCAGVADDNVGDFWYRDIDGDGFGTANCMIQSPMKPCGYVMSDTDCDDMEATANPARSEVCGDNIDNDCNGTVDISCVDLSSGGGI